MLLERFYGVLRAGGCVTTRWGSQWRNKLLVKADGEYKQAGKHRHSGVRLSVVLGVVARRCGGAS